jgi:hypothetical protein
MGSGVPAFIYLLPVAAIFFFLPFSLFIPYYSFTVLLLLSLFYTPFLFVYLTFMFVLV